MFGSFKQNWVQISGPAFLSMSVNICLQYTLCIHALYVIYMLLQAKKERRYKGQLIKLENTIRPLAEPVTLQ